MKGIKYVAVGVVAGLCVACGGGGGGGSSSSAVSGGNFLDSAVGGMNYECFNADGVSVRLGITDSAGFYQFNEGESVQFYFDVDGVDGYQAAGGDIAIGEKIAAAATITPVDVSSNSTVQANIAQFLQAFDSDGDPSNGISIPTEVVDAIADSANNSIDLTAADITASLGTLLTDVKADPDVMGDDMAVPPIADAVAHLDETLATNQDLQSGNSGTALDLPERITLSDSSSGVAQAKVLAAAPAGSDTDYHKAEKRSWIEDSVEGLDIVNDILTMMSESDYQSHVNTGPYRAMVSAVGDDEGGVQQSSTTVEKLQEIVLDITRVDDSSPMIVKMWMVEDNDLGKMLIKGYFSVTEGVSATKPYGAMAAHIRGNSLDAAGAEKTQVVNGETVLADPAFTFAMSIGSDSAGNVEVQVVDSFDEDEEINGQIVNFKGLTKLRMLSSSNLDSGQAYLNTRESEMQNGQITVPFEDAEEEISYFAHNSNYIKIQAEDAGQTTTEVFSKTDLLTAVYQYRLFKADGSKVSLNSGFPILTADGDNGYVGYYGIWMPHGAALSDGQIVTRLGSGKQYQVTRRAGKLRKHTKSTIAMQDLAGLELSYFAESNNEYYEQVIRWNTALNAGNGGFENMGVRDWDTGQIEAANLPVPDFATSYGGVWCQALQSNFEFSRFVQGQDPGNTADDQTLDNTAVISFYKEEVVQPGEAGVPTTFDMWGPENQHDWGNYDPVTDGAIEYTYGDMMLKKDGIDQVYSGDNRLHLGPLVAADTYDDTNWHTIHEAAVYYSWESGPDEWQQFTAIKEDTNADGSFADETFMGFDKPLSFEYQHSTLNDINGDATNNGKTFRLEYDGFMMHVPGAYNELADRWIPFINLEDGTVVGTIGGIDYIVKGVEQSQFPALIQDTTVADDLVIDTTIGAPTISYDKTKTDLVGVMPIAEVEVNKGEEVVAPVTAAGVVTYQWSEEAGETTNFGTLEVTVAADGLSVSVDVLDDQGVVLAQNLTGKVRDRIVELTGVTNDAQQHPITGELRFKTTAYEEFVGNFVVNHDEFHTLFGRDATDYVIDGDLEQQ